MGPGLFLEVLSNRSLGPGAPFFPFFSLLHKKIFIIVVNF